MAATAPSTAPSTTLRGLSSITGIAMMGQPRVVKSPRTIELNVQLYLGQSHQESLFGVFRFYNAKDLVFEEEPSLFIYEATFLQVPEKKGIAPYERSDYDFFGDLQWALPLGSSDLTHHHRPYAHITGLASDSDQSTGRWTVNIEPYASAVFKAEPGSKPVTSLRARAPFLCQHPVAHGSTTKKKPTPYNNRFVVVHGYITDVVFKEGSSEAIERFKVTVDNVEFLGAEPTSGTVIANKLDTPAGSTPRGKGFAGFGKRKSLPATPATPTPEGSSSSKRPRVMMEEGGSEQSEEAPAVKADAKGKKKAM